MQGSAKGTAVLAVLVLGPTVVATEEIQIKLELVTFEVDAPTYLTPAPGDPNRLFVTERDGRILILENGAIQPTPFVDLSVIVGSEPPEGSLACLAFDPDYQTNGLFYVTFTDVNGDGVLARLSVTCDPDVADPASLDVLLFQPQPQPTHNLGWLGFGPDGYLYVAVGDGGAPSDGIHAQNTGSLFGSILRLDVDGDDFPTDPQRDYAIPPTNPLVGEAGLDEIWAYGLRNPWRCSFDRQTGDLWISDVGRHGPSAREEINVQPASSTGGENYGWNCMEGNLCYNPGTCTCEDPGFVVPELDYTHAEGCAVIGGYVYRGAGIPALQGYYLFADHCTGLWGIDTTTGRAVELILGLTGLLYSFGETSDGEIYLLSPSGINRLAIVDCNGNGIADNLDIADLTSDDCNANGIPDECEGDCNDNGAPDDCDISNGTSDDLNGDGIPDECAIPGDVDGDGDVDVVDFLGLLSRWGPCDPEPASCPADFNGDGEVDTVDFLTLLANWS
jgi:glucose/arabinose dehydrogenase